MALHNHLNYDTLAQAAHHQTLPHKKAKHPKGCLTTETSNIFNFGDSLALLW